MAIDVNKEIRRAVDTGKVIFGNRASEKSILKGKAQLVIISSNAPVILKERIKQVSAASKIPFYESGESGLALGAICGKPFVVSTMVVEGSGKSKVLDLTKK